MTIDFPNGASCVVTSCAWTNNIAPPTDGSGAIVRISSITKIQPRAHMPSNTPGSIRNVSSVPYDMTSAAGFPPPPPPTMESYGLPSANMFGFPDDPQDIDRRTERQMRNHNRQRQVDRKGSFKRAYPLDPSAGSSSFMQSKLSNFMNSLISK